MAARTFHVTLTADEEGWIVASVPALTGCHSQGRTREEAIVNIREAIDLWLEVEDEKAIATLPAADRIDLAVA